MNNRITVQSLTREEAQQAFALVKSLCPDISVQRWEDYVETLLAEGGRCGQAGVMIAKDERGYVIGLYSFKVIEDLAHGRTLEVGHFIAADFVGRGRVPLSLRTAMDKQARSMDCQALHVHLPGPGLFGDMGQSSLLGGFRDDGHAVEGLRLCKRFVRENAAG